MKISAIKGFPVKVGHRNQFVVKVETDAGIYGLGEGGISGHELAMNGMIQHFAGFLIGEDPTRIEHIWQTCYRGAYFEGGKIVAAALSAIDCALWDILGKSLGVPVYQLLGGASRQSCPCFATPRIADRSRDRRNGSPICGRGLESAAIHARHADVWRGRG